MLNYLRFTRMENINFKSEMIAEEMHNIYNTFSLQR